jgi:hypothetical protein
MTQALPIIQTPLQPGDTPAARAPDESRPRLTCPQVLDLARHNGVGLLDGQTDEAIDEARFYPLRGWTERRALRP